MTTFLWLVVVFAAWLFGFFTAWLFRDAVEYQQKLDRYYHALAARAAEAKRSETEAGT